MVTSKHLAMASTIWLGIACGVMACSIMGMFDDKLELEQSADHPMRVSVRASESVRKLGEGQLNKATGCGFLVHWGDGSTTPNGPMGIKCAEGFIHDYRKPGTYVVELELWHPGPADAPVIDWKGQASIEVK